MIDPRWCRTMAAYNGEMNRRIYAAAGRLSERDRQAEAGAFFGSVFATLNHILWADHMWMHRFDGWEKPAQGVPDSVSFMPDWEAMEEARLRTDRDIADWAGRVCGADLAGDVTWYSSALQRELRRPRWLLVTHMFNHQTHHRGQVHAVLTQLGQRTGDTDLPWVVDVEALGL